MHGPADGLHGPGKAGPVIQRKDAGCAKGFKRYPRATWFDCDEPGAKNLACSICTEKGKRDSDCHSVASTIGTNLIAPMGVGKCGDIFEVTLPGGGVEHEAIKAEAPGGVDLDMHRDFVVNTLGLPEEQGRYDVCLRRTGRNAARIMKSGPARCGSRSAEGSS